MDPKSNDESSSEEEEIDHTEEIREDLNALLDYVDKKGLLQRSESFYTWVVSDHKEESCKIEYDMKTIDLDGETYNLRHLKIYNWKFKNWEFDIPDFKSILPSSVEWISTYSGENTYEELFRIPKLGEYILVTLSCE